MEAVHSICHLKVVITALATFLVKGDCFASNGISGLLRIEGKNEWVQKGKGEQENVLKRAMLLEPIFWDAVQTDVGGDAITSYWNDELLLSFETPVC